MHKFVKTEKIDFWSNRPRLILIALFTSTNATTNSCQMVTQLEKGPFVWQAAERAVLQNGLAYSWRLSPNSFETIFPL